MGNASTGTKGKGKYASSPQINPDAHLAAQVPATFASPSPLRATSILSFKSLIEDLRQIRDERHYTPTHHCFRAWTMHTFGEKLGGWLDDIL